MEILPILLKGYPDNPRNEQSYSSRQIFHDRVTEKCFRLSAELVFDCICYINNIVDADVFHYIFFLLKKPKISRLLFAKFRYSNQAKIAMNVFCCYIKEELWKKFRIEVDVFVFKKKKFVYFAFSRPLISYLFLMKLLILSRIGGRKKTFFCWL